MQRVSIVAARLAVVIDSFMLERPGTGAMGSAGAKVIPLNHSASKAVASLRSFA
jgi:hypothetical protein